MIELAAQKMPGAHLYQWDFTQGLAEPLKHQRYDSIVATYSLHHLKDEQIVEFLRTLHDHLNENGQILIGDAAFETREELDTCRLASGDKWDHEEICFVAGELRSAFPSLSFTRVSYCASIIMICRRPSSGIVSKTASL